MAHVDKANPGSFCWMELGTTDPIAAKAFYGSLFGWKPNDQDMGPSGVYTIFQLEGRDAVACYTLMPDMVKQGIPPHWMLYMGVANADESAARAKELGANIMAGPFNVMEHGRMAVIKDPAGAVFTVWQSIKHEGIRIKDVHGAFCWADLSTPDVAGATKFYPAMFGWELEPAKDNPYLHIKNGADYIGGILPPEHRNPNAPPHWLIYFTVDDVDATAASAESQGAKIFAKPMTIDKVGRFAVMADPQGAVFAIFKPAARA